MDFFGFLKIVVMSYEILFNGMWGVIIRKNVVHFDHIFATTM
jgi:hypothetical protein